MIAKKPLLVIFVLLIDGLPLPTVPAKRGRGRPVTYTDRLLLKALVIMIIRRLYTAYSLLAFLRQESELTEQFFVLGAIFLYQLILLYQFEAGLPLGQDIRPLLRAA